MPAGRPSKLTKELVEKAKTYDETVYGEATPTVDGLSLFLDVNPDTIVEWRKGDSELAQEFSVTVKRLLSKQALLLQSNGLKGKFNNSIARLMLSANHGMAERTEQDMRHSGDVAFTNAVPRPGDASGSST